MRIDYDPCGERQGKFIWSHEMGLKNLPCWAKVAIAVGLVVFVFNWPRSSGEWAAWVQAVGSIGAIAVAVYVLRKQKQDMVEAEQKAIDVSEIRLLLALRTEICVRQDQYTEKIGKLITDGKLRDMGVFNWKTPDNLFPVYSAMCKDLGLIKSRFS